MSHVSGNMGGIPFGNSSRMEETSDVKETEEAVISQPSSGRLGRRSIGRGPLDQVMQKAIVGGNLRGEQHDFPRNVDALLQGMDSQVKGIYINMSKVGAKHKVFINIVQMHERVTEALGELKSATDSDISKVRQRLRQEVVAEIKKDNPEIKQEAVDEIMEAFDGVVDAVWAQMQLDADNNNFNEDGVEVFEPSQMQGSVDSEKPTKKMSDTEKKDKILEEIKKTLEEEHKKDIDKQEKFLGEEDKNRKKEQMKNNTKE